VRAPIHGMPRMHLFDEDATSRARRMNQQFRRGASSRRSRRVRYGPAALTYEDDGDSTTKKAPGRVAGCDGSTCRVGRPLYHCIRVFLTSPVAGAVNLLA